MENSWIFISLSNSNFQLSFNAPVEILLAFIKIL